MGHTGGRPKRITLPYGLSLPWSGYGKRRRWLYAVGLADGHTKIGITQNPRGRIHCHAKTWGELIQWVHVAGSVHPWRSEVIEAAALDAAAELSQRIGRTEMFLGLTREAAVKCIRGGIAKFAGQGC